MAANQVLAMDAKNLLDAVDKARTHKIQKETGSGLQENRNRGATSSIEMVNSNEL